MLGVKSAILHYENPESLKTHCLRTIIKDPCRIKFNRFKIPQEIGELLMATYKDHALYHVFTPETCDLFLSQLRHEFVPLRKLNLSGLPVLDGLVWRMSESYGSAIEELDLSGCQPIDQMSSFTVRKIFSLFPNVHTLDLGSSISKAIHQKYECVERPQQAARLIPDMRLRKLSARDIQPDFTASQALVDSYLMEVLSQKMAESLTYLDLSMCTIGDGGALKYFKNLETLILYNSQLNFPRIIWTICRLSNLRFLDLSKQYLETSETCIDQESEPDQSLLHLLVKRLPRLTGLDISCTNLAGRKDRYISAFESRLENPFEFLGLFHTTNDTAYRSSLPARVIAGDANESQILNACRAYVNRPDQLARALSDLYNLYKSMTPNENGHQVSMALKAVAPALGRHLINEQVMISATAALWSMVKVSAGARNKDDEMVRKEITSRLLDAMEFHRRSRAILINGGLILLFLPEVVYEYYRVAKMALVMCSDPCPRQQGFGATLMNTLACQVSCEQKAHIAEQGVVEAMMEIIKNKINEVSGDDTLETAWSALWNITDETPVNCQRFLAANGLEAFKNCMDAFSNNKEVLRNIMGLLGNVAECKELRSQFMKEDTINRFYFLLSSNIDGIECSYNAGGILANILSDGEATWNEKLPEQIPRSIICKRLRLVIDSWPINSRRNINYRSFEPIVRLLHHSVTPEAQYWAVFALTNLTRVNPAKYCPMLEPHDGLKMLRSLAENPKSTEPYVNNLARIAVYQYERFQAEGTLSGLEQCKSTDLEVVKNFRAESSVSGDGASETGEPI